MQAKRVWRVMKEHDADLGLFELVEKVLQARIQLSESIDALLIVPCYWHVAILPAWGLTS
jgi:hypothetical protein